MKPGPRSLLALILVHSLWTGTTSAADALRVGVDANYSLGMEEEGARWKWQGKEEELFAGMAARGVRDFRVRLWTKDEGPHGKEYATRVVQRALAAGLDPYLVIFLSEDWADMMKQPLPVAWQGLSFEERLTAVRDYSRDIVAHFRAEGLRNHLYEIGNEIDFGICGEYPGKGTKKNPETLSRNLWPRSAQIIKASQEGVLASDPDAKFMLHIAHWWDARFCEEFFKFMKGAGVRIDYAGLSYFPSSNIGGSLEMEQFGATVSRVAEAAGCPVMVPETAYPSTGNFKGQFSRWKYEVPGYPLSPEGQQRWLADFLAFCRGHEDIAAVYYWSPEWFGEGMWKGFALFDPQGEGKPAWSSFPSEAWPKQAPREQAFLEVRGGEVFNVPAREARDKMVPLVLDLRRETGGVDINHINKLKQTELVVGGHRVDLKGSLTQNLLLYPQPGSHGTPLADAGKPDGKALAALTRGLDPHAHRIVIFAREPQDQGLASLVGGLENRGFEVVTQPVREDAPLRFGLCGAFEG